MGKQNSTSIYTDRETILFSALSVLSSHHAMQRRRVPCSMLYCPYNLVRFTVFCFHYCRRQSPCSYTMHVCFCKKKSHKRSSRESV